MRNTYLLFLIVFTVFSCSKDYNLSDEFTCADLNLQSLKNLNIEKDLKWKFQVLIPNNWKVNLYQDEIQSSIYVADTTVSLSKSTLIDFTWVNKEVNFDQSFKLQNEQEELIKKHIKIKSKDLIIKDLQAHYSLYKGTQNTLSYQTLKTYIKISNQSFLQVKIDIYGDDAAEERMCKAISLVDEIKIIEP